MPKPRALPLPTADSLACRHRGAPTGETRPARPPARGALPVFACAEHGACTLEARAPHLWCCRFCAERQAVEAPPSPDLWEGFPDPLPEGERDDRPKYWHNDPAVRLGHLAALREVAAASLPTLPRASGDGICFIGGGRYWPMLKVAIRMVRRVSDLPIRLYHQGQQEAVRPAELAHVGGVTYHDFAGLRPGRCSHPWSRKVRAILDCPWRRVLFIDADCYPVADVLPIFEQVGAHQPLAYWGDFPNMDALLCERAVGLPGAAKMPHVQTGQFVVDRVHALRLLLTWHFACSHYDFYGKHGYSDQDCMRVALAATGTRAAYLGRHGGYPKLRKDTARVLVFAWNGLPRFVHRVGAKWWGKPDDPIWPDLPGETAAVLCRSDPLPDRVTSAADLVAYWDAYDCL